MKLWFKYRILLPCLSVLPQRLAYRLVSFSARFVAEEHLADTAVIQQQMQRVFEDKSAADIAQASDYFLGLIEREALDTFFFKRLHSVRQIDQFVRLENFDIVLDARARGQRVIISSGHFGRFWMAGVGMQAHGVSVGTITRDGGDFNEHGLPEQEYQYRLKKLRWLQACFRGPFLVEGDAIRPVYRALDEHVMALFIDVPYLDDKNGCISLPFLGKMARFPLGAARIAKRSNAIIVPFYVFESRAGLCARFYEPIVTADLTDAEIMQRLVALLEAQIMAYPEQWWLWQALPLLWQA
ncbi:MAG: lysophospholipid acyltransferase family protein [Methylococcales bacterium]|nr:lysophospholipid acyltransferase family protein [Methylococcales bacterium]